MFVLFGILIDIINKKGPMLSCLLGGISFVRLFLRLIEKNDNQVYTWPNLITSIRILGIVSISAYAFYYHGSDKEEELLTKKMGKIEEPYVYSDYWLAIYGSLFVALDFLDG